MSTNPDYEYKESQRLFAAAKTDDERLKALEYMLQVAPSHKCSENLRASIKTRIAKLKAKIIDKKVRHKKVIKKEGIRKEEGTYTAPLMIRFSYGYAETISKTIQIKSRKV